MKKKLVLISSLCSLAVIGMAFAGVAMSRGSLDLRNAKAGENDYSITINRDTIQKDGTKYFVETSKGNRINLTRANCAMFDEEEYGVPSDAFCYFRGNGGGLYIDTPIQSIASVTTIFSFNESTTSNNFKICFGESNDKFANPHLFQTDASDSGTPVIPEVTQDRYITYWYNSSGATYHAEIKSIVINYTCA